MIKPAALTERRACSHRLLRTLLQVAVAAQHLAVVGRGLATLAPRNDMVRVHLLVLEVLAADRADALLALIRRTRIALVEGADGQRLLLARQQVLVDTRLPGDILVRHQLAHALLKRLRVEVATLMMLVIEQAPRETLHLLALLREHSLHPLDNRAEVTP